MDENNNTIVSANNSSTDSPLAANEIAAASQAQTAPQATTRKVKAIITAITRGASEDTKNSLFFRSQNPVFPKTDENGIHSIGYSFGKSIQCVEDLIALYPFRIKAKFSQIKEIDNKLDFANMLFQSMTGKAFIVTFELIPANYVYRNAFSKSYDWWCATNVSGAKIELDGEEINFAIDEAEKYIEKEKQAGVPQWTQVR